MSGLVRLLVAAAAMLAAGAVFLALYVNARHRARVSHCRNNLRHLGGVAARNAPLLDPSRSGRAFWQGVRELEYRTVRGEWRPMNPDPFVCPVLGTTVSRPEDPASIDYRGPVKVRERFEETLKDEPAGADRPGNHPDGGHVLYLDLSVREVPAEVRAAGASDPAWAEVGRFLTD